MQVPVKIIIPSHKRAERVLTTSVVADAAICVPESQKEEYERHNPDNGIIVHPDNVIGLTAKRQWIYEQLGDVFMLDDDIVEMKRLYTTSNYRVKNKQEVRDIIYACADAARQAGAYLFGFNKNPSPIAYSSHKPISMTGYITGCATGLLSGSKLFYDTAIKCNEDYWISCLNAHFHRYIWRDNRFTFVQKNTFVSSGGLAEFRNLKAEEEDFAYLQKMFGKEVIQLKKDSKLRKQAHQFEKTMKLPF